MRHHPLWLRIVCASSSLPLLASASLVRAQEESAVAGDEPSAEAGASTSGDAELPPGMQPKASAAASESAKEPRYFLGLNYRHSFTPAFMFKPFLAEALSANNPAVGAEFTIRRRENFDIVTGLWWQGFRAYGPFRAKSDPPEDTEIIDSNLSALFAGVTLLWSTPLVGKVLALQYGAGFGFGVALGKLKRTEAYQDAQGEWQPCNGPNDPAPSPYCDSAAVGDDSKDGGHFGVVSRRWSNGGNIPNVWFRAAPQIGLRYMPIPKVMTRLDMGFDLFSGFFVGVAAAYGIR